MTPNEYSEYKKNFMRKYNKKRQREKSERLKQAIGDCWWLKSYINGKPTD